ncbi:hypothetical protein C2845_PM02G03420 [Panicum miliaceum]|uniref:Uncharacterized protein n=1 Tax=Panicum miliaceum TaxID=4540 RepID=A0A3L6SGJ5_PANMI|nr:hypothetical protein C2845_PM02G03420 [Panicum miliaceum]
MAPYRRRGHHVLNYQRRRAGWQRAPEDMLGRVSCTLVPSCVRTRPAARGYAVLQGWSVFHLPSTPRKFLIFRVITCNWAPCTCSFFS